MSLIIRKHIWNSLKSNRFLLNYKTSPPHISRKFVTSSPHCSIKSFFFSDKPTALSPAASAAAEETVEVLENLDEPAGKSEGPADAVESLMLNETSESAKSEEIKEAVVGGAVLENSDKGEQLDGENVKSAELDETPQGVKLTAEMTIDSKMAGKLIGHRGSNIRLISKLSNCKVTLDQVANTTGKRQVFIEGESDRDIAEAKRVIEEALTNDHAFMNKALACEIPRAAAGRLVGKAGWNIHRMTVEHDCQITLDDMKDHERENVTVKFSGDFANCEQARQAVLMYLDMAVDTHAVSVMVPERFCAPLIGRSGSNISVLKRLTRCEMQLEKLDGDQEVDENQEKTLVIRGQQSDCEDAEIVIRALINLFKRHREAGNLLFTEIPLAQQEIINRRV